MARQARRAYWILAGGLVLFSTLMATYSFGYTVGFSPPAKGPVTTFGKIVDGQFESADDKAGSGGVMVTVRNVVLRQVTFDEIDGDWHYQASDPSWASGNFVLEVIPRDQDHIGKPPLNRPLEIMGVPYCDRLHTQEAERFTSPGWHTGGSCWELHPFFSWRQQ